MAHPQIVGDRYEIIGRIGKGGMANVYRGKDTRLLREIAVKILVGADKEGLFYFHREARAIAALRHQNIVQIYDYSGPDESPAYIVMELIEGGNIDEVLMVRHPLPEDIIVSSAYGVASALQHAHEHGVIHRDIKPANVMVEESGRLLLTDFGIAKAYRDAAQLGQTFSGKATQLFGTPDFMAPEQILEEELGPHTDVFTLGSLIYCLATNYSPFDHTDTVEILRRVVDVDFQPLEERRQGLSAKLNAIVNACLQADVRARPTSGKVAEYCEDLLFEHRVSNSQRNLFQYLRGERAEGDKPLGITRDLKGDDTEDDLAWSGDDGAPTTESLAADVEPAEEAQGDAQPHDEEDSRGGDTQIYGGHTVEHLAADESYVGESEDEASSAITGEVDGIARDDANADRPPESEAEAESEAESEPEPAATPGATAGRRQTLLDHRWLDPRSPVAIGVLTTLLVTIVLSIFFVVRDSDDGEETADTVTEITVATTNDAGGTDDGGSDGGGTDETAAVDPDARGEPGGDLTGADGADGAEGVAGDESGGGGGSPGAVPDADGSWEETIVDTEEGVAGTEVRSDTRPGKSRTKAKGKKRKRSQTKKNQSAKTKNAGKSTITITVRPWGTVFLDGDEKGNTPVVRVIEVKPGKHTIKVTHPTLGSSQKSVTAKAGDNTPVVIDLRGK